MFQLNEGTAVELQGRSAGLEKSLQNLFESNLETMLGIRFLASEHTTGRTHGGRVDTLGLDENGGPVIIEYKRALNENVINQGLFYLDWLMDHKAEFKLLVLERLGPDTADGIDWSSPRLLCIAGDFTRYDEHAVKQMNRNIELLRYKRFGDGLVLLELVNATTATGPGTGGTSTHHQSIAERLEQLDGELKDRYEELEAFLKALGDDVQVTVQKSYVAFKRLRNFACVAVFKSTNNILVWVKVDPDDVELEEGFTRDMRNIGHAGTGDLEINISSREELIRAQQLLTRSYESS